MEKPKSEENELPLIDVSEKFQNMSALDFLDHLEKYRKQGVHLSVKVPWKGSENLPKRLKAFIEGREGSQERSAAIIGSNGEKEEALNLNHVANALSSGVKWIVPKNKE